MARTINAGENVKRTDTFFVDPREVLVNWDRNGRHDTFTPEAIARLAVDMEENGQLQPVACRSMPAKRVELIYGFNRLRAALEIVKRRPDFRLHITVYDGINERDAFLMNLRENMIRTEVSAIDNGYNVRKLMNQFGFTAQEVAELYKRSTSWVGEVLKLLTLPEDVKDAVADGVLTSSAGLLLTKLPEAEASAVLAEAVKAVADAEQAEEAAIEAEESKDALPLDALPSNGKTVEDEELAAAIAGLPSRPRAEAAADAPRGDGKGKGKNRKKDSELTPAEVQSRKTVRQAKISAAAKKAAAAKGVKVARSLPELKALIKNRADEVSVSLLGFFDGTVSEDDLIDALDRCESPIISTKGQKPVKAVTAG